ncbi:MAG: hypothetical protein UT17_C0007G0012 [Candidatus Woesebacteria bacterium GW2011_GWB1_39_10]|uniref:Methyltransferase type 11 domain-containing protein n=1 Tax=Candidatus Woesebacteria bacterium GW2011_GWB1_39_10 TaxID=1618572 RepID=A0A0G0PQ48_9BACT|nr:MAG: hypothetical protein UT17_C0007G0012 [Candidatus Woesebacteria bacterium GW2011_GWB1_39_10]
MKNIIQEKPTNDLHGRLLHTIKFIDNKDIKNKIVLDIGCGYGWCELNLLKRGVKKIYATEVTSEDLDTIKKNIKHPKVVYQVANATNLPFPDKSVDTVLCWEVIEHIPVGTEKQLFSEVHRILKPYGSFYLSTPYKSWPSMVFDPAWWLIGHRHYSLKELNQYANSKKMTMSKNTIKGRWWELTGILNMYFSKWILRRNPLFRSMFYKKIDHEYKQPGFIDIFVKFTK